MLIDPEERTLFLRGRGNEIRTWDIDTGEKRSFRLGDAKHLALRAGRAGHFGIWHIYDVPHKVLTVHHFAQPTEILGRAFISQETQEIEGPLSVWKYLPRHYLVDYLDQDDPLSQFDPYLITIAKSGTVSLQPLEWYNYEPHQKLYHMVLGVTDIPDSDLVLVSIQRSSKLILHDPIARRKVGEVVLSEHGGGNPKLYFSRTRSELWADDYDTLVVVEPGSWRILRSRKLQEPEPGWAAMFIGDFAFNADESICSVARPFSGDIVGLDPETLRIRYRAKLGNQPMEVLLLRDRRVFSRDWKTGKFLRGRLEPVDEE